MERSSDLTSFAAPRAPRDLAQPCDPRIAPDLARRICLVGIGTVSVVVVKTGRVVSRVAQPNGVRLSCAAVLWFSQLQFYYDGRRQLQPLVRLRTDNRRSHPARNRGHSTHRVPPRTAAVTPTRAMLGFTSDRRPRRPTRPSSKSSLKE